MRTNTHTRQHRLTRPLGSGPANWEYWLERFYCSSPTSRAETQLGTYHHFEPTSAPRTVDWKHPHRIPKPDEDAYLRRFSTAYRRPGPWAYRNQPGWPLEPK